MATLPPLRPYQRAMLDHGRRLIIPRAPASLLFQLATGGGKTLLGLTLALSHLAISPLHRVLWFAHRDELVEQPLAKLRAYGAPVAALRPGEPPPGDARIVIASVQTVLARGLDVLPRSTLVVFDEARHYVEAPEWSQIALAVSDGRHRIGLDATPRGPLHTLFQHLVPGPSIASLTDDGHLVPAVHIGPRTERDALAEDPVEAYLRHVAPDRAIIFCRDGAHARAVCAAAAARGIRAACILDKTPPRQRRAALDDYLRGAIDVLVNVACLVEGTDLPPTVGIVVARRIEDEETWVQVGGRGLRPSPGKTCCKLVDLYGLTWRLGLLGEERPWSIDGKGLPRRPADLPPCVTCPNCLALAPPSGVCPGCLSATPPRPPPKLTKAEMLILAQDRRARSGGEWERFCALIWEGRAKGWKPRAPFFLFMQQYGHAPKWREDHVPPAPTGWIAPSPPPRRISA